MHQNIDNVFYLENLKKANRVVFIFIRSMNFVPLGLIFLTATGIFQIPVLQIWGFLVLTLGLTVTDYFLIKHAKTQHIAQYAGLMFINLMVAYVGINPNIQINIVFSLAPIISCFYFDFKFTRNMAVISYVLMVLSMYLKSFGIVLVMNYKGRVEPMAWFIPEITGMTMQYAFVCILAWLFTQQTQNSLFKVFSLNKQIDSKNEELENTQFKIIQFIAQVLDSHDLFTGRHVIHTQRYVEMICRQLRQNGFYTEELTDSNIRLFPSAAFLHDIGKVHIPEGVLNKVGKFTDEEFAVMKQHPEEGRKLLQFFPQIEDGKFNEIAIQMTYCHHEKWNGTGYPQGIKEYEIPLCARIMTAADVLDALISRRLYKEPMSVDKAMQIFEESKGTHFEACIADAVIQCRAQIAEIDREFKQAEEETNVEELERWKRYSALKK